MKLSTATLFIATCCVAQTAQSVYAADTDAPAADGVAPRPNLRRLNGNGGVFNGKNDNGGDKVTLIVALTKDASNAGPFNRCARLSKANGGETKHVYDKVLNGCAITMPRAAMNALKNDADVKYVEEDWVVHASVDSPTWGQDRIDQCSGRDNAAYEKMNASGVRVYIVDTGIRGTHEQFADMISTTSDCHNDQIEEAGGPLADGNGHGTHVAGTTCGRDYGVSENCELCAVKVLSARGSGSGAGVIAGINHVAGNCATFNGPCVANMSLGGGFNQAENDAVADAVAAGVTMVVAAGNSNDDACNYSPASEPMAITVGSTTSSDTRSSFSSFGSCVDVYAPGSNILSAWTGSDTATTTISGTSMASPHVAGIVAGIHGEYMASNNSELSPADAEAVLVEVNAKYIAIDKGDVKFTTTIGCNAPTPAPTPCTGQEIKIEVNPDDYPAETSYTLTDDCANSVVASRPAGSASGTNVYCHPNTAQYTFTISDTFGDGLCCAYGNGWYKVTMDDVDVAYGDSFGLSESKTFGSCGPVTPGPTPPPAPATPNPTFAPTSEPTPAPTPAPVVACTPKFTSPPTDLGCGNCCNNICFTGGGNRGQCK